MPTGRGAARELSPARQVFGWPERHRRAADLVENGDAEGAAAELRRVLAEHPDDAAAHSELLFLLHYREEDPVRLYREHRAWAARHAPPPMPATFTRSGSKVRVGYVSPHFRELNPILSFIEPVLREHDRRRFHIICYSDAARPDSGTARARALADEWRDIYGAGDEETAALIRADAIDVLVDLAGHLAGNRLLTFSRRPAPLQATWIGYPDTTGLPAMDYRLTDAAADPPGLTEAFHSEKLARLERSFLCYQPPAASPPVAALPAWFAGHVTFGCFQYPAKVTAEVIRQWAEVLRRTPRSRLLLHHCFSDYGLPDSACRRRITAEAAKHGIEPGRLEFAGSLAPGRHLELYGRIDAVLDSYPYNGTTSTCEALWMGVPVVSRSGGFHVTRVGCSLLSRVGLEALAASTWPDFIDRAVELAADLDRLTTLRAGMRARMCDSALMQAGLFTRAWEARCLEWLHA